MTSSSAPPPTDMAPGISTIHFILLLSFLLSAAPALCEVQPGPAIAATRTGDDSDQPLFTAFAEAVRGMELDRAEAIAAGHALPEWRQALAAVVTIYRGDIAAGEGILDRLAATSGDERLFDLISTLYERPEYMPRPTTPTMTEARFKQKGMEYLQAAVGIRLRKEPFQQPVVMFPPLKGRWAIASGPLRGRTYHSTFNGFFGYDLWYPPGRFEDSFGRPVFAVAAGVVVSVVDDQDDHPPAVKYQAESRANTIVVEHDGGIVSRYVHLKKGSALVRKGERVQAGQQLASIGNSGFTGGPHLHFSISRRGSSFTLPVRMTGLYHLGEESGGFTPTEDLSLASGRYSDSANLPASNGRSYSYDGGRFLRGEGMAWNEFDDRGKLKFRFAEKRRSDGMIYLWDEQRRVMVRLPAAGGLAEYSTNRERSWTRFELVIED